MRTTAVFLVLLSAVPAARGDARAVAERAARATAGSPDNLPKLRTLVQLARGKLILGGNDATANRDFKLSLPDAGRWDFVVEVGGMNSAFSLVLAGQRGWTVRGGTPVDMSNTEVDDVRDDLYAYSVAYGFVWHNDPAYTLAAAPGTAVNGRPTDAVLVTRKNRPDVTLYFDQPTGLLARASYVGREIGVPVKKEWTFSDHRPFGGFQLPGKVSESSNNRKVAEWAVTEYKFPEKADAGAFKR